MSRRLKGLRRLGGRPVGVIALAWLVLVVVACLAAPLLAPYTPNAQDLAHVLSGPSSQHLLGTGVLGRDELSRLLYGGRVTLAGVGISCALYLAVGVPLGLLAGYLGGIVDRLVLRLADVVFSVPLIIVLLVVVAIFPGDEAMAMVALGLLAAPGLARIVRSITQGLRQELYVRAARTSGLRPLTIMRRHLLPQLSGTVIVQLSLFAAAAVLLETGLGFLGVGSQQATWGGQIAEASQELGTQPWLLVPSGFVVISFILALGLVGDMSRDLVAARHGARSGPNASRPRPVRNPPISASPQDVRREADAAALLSVRDLRAAFGHGEKAVTVVSGVDLDVLPGESVGILGESGCGKSVTVRAILGLLGGDGRAEGTAVFEGEDLLQSTPAALRAVRGRRIGWISQEPISGLDPAFTAGAQVAEAIRAHHKLARHELRRRTRDLLARVRLPNPDVVARQYPHELSGGMAQRVGIAAALSCDPALIIADEPTTALDVTVQAEILDLLRDLQAGGVAIVLVTHDWGVLADLCQRAVVMYAGQVVEEAPLVDLLVAPKHPYTAALLAANPHGARPGEPLTAIDGSVPSPGEWPTGCRFADRCAFAQDDCRHAPIPLVALDASRRTRCLHHDLLDVAPAPNAATRETVR